MKKLLTLILSFLIAVSFSFGLANNAFAAKKKNQAIQSLKAVNNNGETEINGSVLSPKVNDVNILLSKQLLAKIRSIGIENLSVTLTSTIDSTKTFSIETDGLSIQRKAINKIRGAYLIVSLFNLTNASGVTISPSSLPSDNYKLTITGEGLNATTDAFLYRTPALIVGTVDSKTTGLVSVDDIQGIRISEGTVATNPNGTFFTEVRANKINSNTKARRYLKAQTTDENSDSTDTNNDIVEEIDLGVINIVAEKDLSAIVDLSNNDEINAKKANDPIVVNDETTLTAKLAIEGAKEGNEDLAVEVAKDQLDNLSSEEDESDDTTTSPSNDTESDLIDCNIDQFTGRCSDTNTDFASIGKDFKNFVQTASCNFPEFDLIKKIVLASNDDANSFIGKGYCEHATRQEDNNKPCEIYATILKNHQSGLEIGLPPCPPPGCPQFKNITVDNTDPSKRCFEPKRFCEGTAALNGPCIPKPRKEIYCAKIGTDINESECVDDEFDHFKKDWVVETADSDGAQYCVPSNFPKPVSPPSGSFGPKPPSTSKDLANQCPINSCHRDCDKKYPPQIYTPAPVPSSTFSTGNYQPPKCDVCECHNVCEKQAGRYVDCNAFSDYFKKDECCRTGSIIFAQTTTAYQSVPPSYPTNYQPYSGNYPTPTATGPQYVAPDVHSCLCGDPNNFDSKGYAKKEAQNACKEKCPDGFEKDQNSQGCVRKCPEGTFRDPRNPYGSCRKKCPEGFIDDGFTCRCPEGKILNYTSGKCETSSTCPDYCKNVPMVRKYLEQIASTGPGYIPPGSTGSSTLPPECQKCFGGPGVCPTGYINVNGQCQPSTNCSSNMLPNSNSKGEAQCICPDGLPYWDGYKCIASCPNGAPATTSTANLPPRSPIPCDSSTISNYCSPAILVSTSGCTCNPAGGGYNLNGYCTCPTNSGPYTKETGCNPSTTQCPAPYVTNPTGNPPCKCPDSLPYASNTNNGSTCVAACPAGLSPAYPPSYGNSTYNSLLTCLCPDKTYPNQNGQCTGSSTNYCPPAVAPTSTNPCTCNPSGGAYFNSNNVCTCSSTSQTYTKENGCSDSSTTSNYCSPAILVGTSGCTCNPAGGGYNSNGYCTCPANSGPYTKETGCTSTSTNQCPAPYIKDSAFPNQCACPPSTPYELGTTCVVSCPSNLVASVVPGTAYSSSRQVCKCTDGSYPTGSGTCSSSTSNYCSPGIAVDTNSCTCNPTGGGYNSNGYCACPANSGPYTKETGCPSSTSTNQCPAPYVTNTSGTAPCKCPDGSYYYNNSCVTTCPDSLVVGTPSSGGGAGPIPSCLCPETLQSPGANGQCGSSSTNYCSPGITVGTSSCTCNPNGGSQSNSSTNFCECSDQSKTYTKENGCS